jgi:hypothetical protein
MVALDKAILELGCDGAEDAGHSPTIWAWKAKVKRAHDGHWPPSRSKYREVLAAARGANAEGPPTAIGARTPQRKAATRGVRRRSGGEGSAAAGNDDDDGDDDGGGDGDDDNGDDGGDGGGGASSSSSGDSPMILRSKRRRVA